MGLISRVSSRTYRNMSGLARLGNVYRTHFLRDLSSPGNVTVTGYVSRSTKMFFNLKCPESGGDHVLQVQMQPDARGAPTIPELLKNEKLTVDSAISVTGQLVYRPEQHQRENEPLGAFELIPQDVKMYNQCVPALHRNRLDSEDWRRAGLEYQYKNRFLGLRSAKLQSILKARSKIIHKMREILHDRYDFTEIETPTLFSPTPGGAREFVVPSSYYEHKFYSLVQSPQQFKQLLMIGGFNRYFQVAKCYRNEKLRDDRQPEFTQLDMELAYCTREEIMALVEDVVRYAVEAVLEKKLGDSGFQKMSYNQAMAEYGCDKPDTRFGLKIDGTKLAYGDLASGKQVKKLLNNMMKAREFKERCVAGELVHDKAELTIVCEDVSVLGDIRSQMGKEFADLDTNQLNFLWVIDFPLFEAKEADMHRGDTQSQSHLQTVHHPFTAPLEGKLEATASCTSAAYDLVLNGQEVGGGSIRIHDPKMQEEVFKILDINKNGELDHIVSALSAGAPPHGGLALGLDRLLAILLDVESIQDVM